MVSSCIINVSSHVGDIDRPVRVSVRVRDRVRVSVRVSVGVEVSKGKALILTLLV
jgi:hypothetical protein